MTIEVHEFLRGVGAGELSPFEDPRLFENMGRIVKENGCE